MNRLLTPQQVADLLQVKKSTIYQWSHQGYIPHIKLKTNVLRFSEARVMEWLEKRARKGRTGGVPNIDIH